MDFVTVKHRTTSKGNLEVYPDFLVTRSKDIMVRGGAFYAIWDEEKGLWSTNEYDVQSLVDKELRTYADALALKTSQPVTVKAMYNFSSTAWSQFRLYISKLSDHYTPLDTKLTFSNTKVVKKDYASMRLDYPLEAGSTKAFDEMFSTLFDEENLTKIMWAIGSIVSGDSVKIQKFFVLYGAPGTGKSTVLNLIQRLCAGYTTSFEAKTLTAGNNNFPSEVFRNNPLVGISHEGDLSVVRDNSVLNSIVAHDSISMNVKYRSPFSIRLLTMLFVATNKPVNITDSKSGLIRRLIDIRPTGQKVDPVRYDELVSMLEFELGAIADKCLSLYLSLGKSHYSWYKPVDMILRTNPFFNFVDEYSFEFRKDGYITLQRAWTLYKEYCDQSNIEHRMSRYNFRDEMKNYWTDFDDIKRIDNNQLRSVFSGFDDRLFGSKPETSVAKPAVEDWLSLRKQKSVLDVIFALQPAQYAAEDGLPGIKWDDNRKTLKGLTTSRMHYCIPPPGHIVVDFDIKGPDGKKSLRRNIEAARRFPSTYAEVSQGGEGLHLHYYYDGDTTTLSRIFEHGIEVLVPSGNFSIRRRLSMCNEIGITTINSGLPIKDTTMTISDKTIKTERGLRTLIGRNLHKEIHPATKPSVDFIDKILREAYDSGLEYDVTDMKPSIIRFASNSSNQASYCVKVALSMMYQSEEPHALESRPEERTISVDKDSSVVFFDVEVFPNLVLICWKEAGEGKSVVRMINPSSSDIEPLLSRKLVGFNNRKYDNHILYAIYLGFTVGEVYQISRRIVELDDNTAKFRGAYALSYLDVFDYASTKQGLKKWQIQLGLLHVELNMAWDKPVPESDWTIVGDYCSNDVTSLEALYIHLEEDLMVRMVLSVLSGLPPNDGDLAHASRIIFGTDRNPQKEFNYPNLADTFPGYKFEMVQKDVDVILDSLESPDLEDEDEGLAELEWLTEPTPKRSGRIYPQSTYKGEIIGEGGYIFAKPGMHYNVLYQDVASMHPSSIEALNLFGKYTRNYSEFKDVRMALKEGRTEDAVQMFRGVLAEFIKDPTKQSGLSKAFKLVLNRVYGYTYARFACAFRDPRNVDNIVAKRGALFMADLRRALDARGVDLVHIKTDSVKIANYTLADAEFVVEFGKKYGYTFKTETVFEKLVIINDAVAAGKTVTGDWYTVGTRFIRPYITKKLFTKEKIVLADLTETKSVKKGHLYVDLPGLNGEMVYIGKVGSFCPVTEAAGGGKLYRVVDGKKYAATGTSGYLWLPAYMMPEDYWSAVDHSFYQKEVDDAIKRISKFGDAYAFLEIERPKQETM